MLGADHPVPWESFAADYDTIRDAIAAVCRAAPTTTPGYVSQMASNCRIRQGIPVNSHRHGKGELRGEPDAVGAGPPGRLVLQTLRSHDQYNTTIYGLDDRYRGVKGGRRVVFVNSADIESLGLAEGDRVDLVSEFTDGAGRLQSAGQELLIVPYSTPVGNAAAYYPRPNPLVPLDHVAARSNTPVSKAVVIRLEPGGQDPEGGAAWAG